MTMDSGTVSSGRKFPSKSSVDPTFSCFAVLLTVLFGTAAWFTVTTLQTSIHTAVTASDTSLLVSFVTQFIPIVGILFTLLIIGLRKTFNLSNLLDTPERELPGHMLAEKVAIILPGSILSLVLLSIVLQNPPRLFRRPELAGIVIAFCSLFGALLSIRIREWLWEQPRSPFET